MQQSSLERGLKSEELNDDCDVNYLCCLSDFMQPQCICSPQFPTLAPALALAGSGKLESGAS